MDGWILFGDEGRLDNFVFDLPRQTGIVIWLAEYGLYNEAAPSCSKGF